MPSILCEEIKSAGSAKDGRDENFQEQELYQARL